MARERIGATGEGELAAEGAPEVVLAVKKPELAAAIAIGIGEQARIGARGKGLGDAGRDMVGGEAELERAARSCAAGGTELVEPGGRELVEPGGREGTGFVEIKEGILQLGRMAGSTGAGSIAFTKPLPLESMD